MTFILSEVIDLQQHIETLHNEANDYQPSQCPSCGRTGLWKHGTYYRRRALTSRKIPIQRFLCPHCNKTCSTLPEFISPRRQFQWFTQQMVMQLMLTTNNLNKAWKAISSQPGPTPSMSTIRRWWRHTCQQYPQHRFHLCNAHPELGYSSDQISFWKMCLDRFSLSNTMFILANSGHPIP